MKKNICKSQFYTNTQQEQKLQKYLAEFENQTSIWKYLLIQ